MWTSDALHGPNANWRHLGALFTTSLDVLPSAHLRKEFTTSNFFGGIPGDPLDGRTRVITNGGAAEDGGSTEFYIGTQEPGSKFVLGRGEHAVGMIDWGSFAPVDGSSRGLAGLRGTHSRGQSMCRTLGGDANQVAVKGRRVMVCWMGGPGGAEPRHPGWPTQALQSLSREISLSSESELLQQFVPEYRALRTTVLPAATADESHVGTQLISGTHLEIACTFSVLPGGNHSAAFGVSVFAASDDGRRRTDLLVDLRRGYFTLDATAQGELSPRSGPVRGSTARISMHAILDGNAIEAIFNNREPPRYRCHLGCILLTQDASDTVFDRHGDLDAAGCRPARGRQRCAAVRGWGWREREARGLGATPGEQLRAGARRAGLSSSVHSCQPVVGTCACMNACKQRAVRLLHFERVTTCLPAVVTSSLRQSMRPSATVLPAALWSRVSVGASAACSPCGGGRHTFAAVPSGTVKLSCSIAAVCTRLTTTCTLASPRTNGTVALNAGSELGCGATIQRSHPSSMG